MSWVPAEKVLATVVAQRQVLASEQARIANAQQYHANERQKLESERAQAVHDLGQAILPKLDAASIAKASQTTGLVGLPNENIPAQLEARRAWLASRLTAISQDPRYLNRELLRHPRTGSLVTAIAEAEELRRPFAETLSICNDHPRFPRLWNENFGTPEYTGSWWRFSYWSDRSAAKELIALFPGKTTFAEVREEFRVAGETVASYDTELARLRSEFAAGEALDREYAAHYDEYTNLDARGLEHTRGRIVQHLLTSDAGLVSQRLASASALRLLFLRASGLGAKVTYLDSVQQANVSEMQKDLAAQQQKLDSVETRTRRRWAPMPMDKYQKLAEDRRPRYEKRWQRYGKVYTSVYSFNRWDRGMRFEDLLWWDIMTRGRYDGSYIHDVHDFHRSHPSYSFDPEDLKGSNADFFGPSSGRGSSSGSDTSDIGTDTSDDLSSRDDAEAAALSVDADTSSDSTGDQTRDTDAS